jgi:hypothetical protein
VKDKISEMEKIELDLFKDVTIPNLADKDS